MAKIAGRSDSHGKPLCVDPVLAIELTGPDAQPKTIESRTALELATAYLSLIESLAKAQDRGDLNHTGIEVVDKCVELRFFPNDLDLAQTVAVEAHRCITGRFPAPRGTKTHVERVQKAVREHKRQGRSVMIKVADWQGMLDAPPDKPPMAPSGITSLRVEVVEVGGEEDAKVRFASRSEPDSFRVNATKDQCEALGRYLYKHVDADLRILRGADGQITGGDLIEFFPLDAVDSPAAAMLAWIDKAGEGWEDSDDPRTELGRGD